MGLKYSINSAGRIVAERDIYSLGGFIPKGRLGGFIADETQLSQDGECWVAGGDISGRPDVRVKDNAYIGDFFAGTNPVHTDIITEFSGNTLIPGYSSVRSLVADTKNNTFIKDSFIGVSVDALCGPSTTTTAFPFEQGDFKKEAAKGTLFTSASMRLEDVSACRNTATLRLGRNTYLYIPTGYRARVFWAYYDTSNQLAYSGESTAVAAGLTKLDHSVYRLAMVAVAKADGTAMTPTDLLATGAKILGHINSSPLMDIRPESASGEYAMVNSSFIAETNNFGLNTTQLRFLAGSMYDTTMYTKTDRPDYKLYGTFRNVERLEYTKYLPDSYRTAATRDTCISAYDCPLLRVDNTTYNDALAAKGNLVLRRCIVPKAIFTDNIHNGNVYEDIDFSYASDHLGAKAGNNFDMWSSHKQGEYAAIGAGTAIAGLISRPENLAAGSVLGASFDFLPLDGSIVEQGYFVGSAGTYYEDMKVNTPDVVRTARPVSTIGLTIPALSAGYLVRSIYYFTEDFKLINRVSSPTSVDTTRPYAMFDFWRDGGGILNASDFIALGLSLRMINYGKVPEITGSAYLGAGVTVRGDVQLHGDPYVNRIFDVNEWDRGGLNTAPDLTWDVMKDGRNSDIRMTTKSIYPVNPGDTISVSGAYRILLCWFNSDQKLMSDTGWNDGTLTVPANVHYVGIALSTKPDLKFLDFPDIPLANVKYLRAFKKRRYITNELDRKSPEDILLGSDYWEQGSLALAVGILYEKSKIPSLGHLRLKRPVNVGSNGTYKKSTAYNFNRYGFDAATKYIGGNDTALLGVLVRKEPSATIVPADIADARVVIEFTPSPRVITPYGVSNVWIEGTKVRMYDNSVISRTITKGQEVTLKGDAVMGTVFIGDVCICSNGHDDAIIKLP